MFEGIKADAYAEGFRKGKMRGEVVKLRQYTDENGIAYATDTDYTKAVVAFNAKDSQIAVLTNREKTFKEKLSTVLDSTIKAYETIADLVDCEESLKTLQSDIIKLETGLVQHNSCWFIPGLSDGNQLPLTNKQRERLYALLTTIDHRLDDIRKNNLNTLYNKKPNSANQYVTYVNDILEYMELPLVGFDKASYYYGQSASLKNAVISILVERKEKDRKNGR